MERKSEVVEDFSSKLKVGVRPILNKCASLDSAGNASDGQICSYSIDNDFNSSTSRPRSQKISNVPVTAPEIE